MKRENAFRHLIAPMLASFFCAAPTAGQVITNGQNPLDNAAAAGARAPGNMVAAGVAQAFGIHDDARAGHEITETETPTSVRAQALADSIAILFEQLNQAITAFHNLLLLRGGRTPTITGVMPASGTGGDLTNLLGQSGGRRKSARQIDTGLKTPASRAPSLLR